MPESHQSLIINSPYTEPSQHWEFAGQEQPHKLVNSRREAGYVIADPRAKPYQDKGIFMPLPLVNQIRSRVKTWRDANYPGITGITKALLDHWHDTQQRENDFFFCQIEAIETLIWLVEAPNSEKVGIEIPNDGGEFTRLCCKLATGAGKTVVMAMLIAWQAINKITYPQDTRFAKHFLVVTPGLTVKNRLAVLQSYEKSNYYDEFGIVPLSMKDKLRQGKVLIHNWHALSWETDEKIRKKKSVDKRGAKSDEAYTREVLGEIANVSNLVVINDEAHHAWRVSADEPMKGATQEEKEEKEKATKWIGGLDRIHKTRGILNCFDFSATPFSPNKDIRTNKEAMFGWIVSDFGLNDAIESGLVKTPRVVVDDNLLPNAQTYKPRLYHIYSDSEVKDDINRKAEPHEPLPDLVTSAYALLGGDWEKTKDTWEKHKCETPPVMITVANRTETAARIKYAFENKMISVEALCEREGILHIDSKELKKVENEDTGDETLAQRQREELLRQKVSTVGQHGKEGADIQNVISVGMLSEGWDAHTVTHIMGLRAFTSQLLCEQVVGRGLRRASYEINPDTGLFDPEYVNVFGVPFSFLPHEKSKENVPAAEHPKITIMPVDKKKDYQLKWQNIIRIDREYRPRLSVDWDKVGTLELNTENIAEIAKLAPTVDNKPDFSKVETVDIERLIKQNRLQTMVFKTAKNFWESTKPNWNGSAAMLMAQLVELAEEFIRSDRIKIFPRSYDQDEKRRHLVITLSMSKVIRHFSEAINHSNSESLVPVFDRDRPFYTTQDMRPWRTSKPVKWTKRSHINYCIFDSTWESSTAFELDRNKLVKAWVKNDHLNFEVPYIHGGIIRKYFPDFLVQLQSGDLLVLEVKGQETEQDKSKHQYMEDWIEAINTSGTSEDEKWYFRVSKDPSDIKDILNEVNAGESHPLA